MECPLIHKYGKESPGVVDKLETFQEYNHYDYEGSDSGNQSHQSQESAITPKIYLMSLKMRTETDLLVLDMIIQYKEPLHGP